SISAGPAQFAAIQAVAPSFGVELSPLGVGDASEIEHTLGSFARGFNGGLIVTASALVLAHRDLITTLAARHKLPAVYFQRPFVAGGGLISSGPHPIDPYRAAPRDRHPTLRGRKAAAPPRQAATKEEMVINVKSGRALGLEIPPTLLARADEVIE